MKAALAVHRLTHDLDADLASILAMANQAAEAGADLVLFPEAALTGLINNDDPSHDLPLGQPIPGPITDALAALAHKRHLYLALGLLEREGQTLYDSAVLLTPQGDIGLKYRRLQPQWHGKNADPAVYRQGQQLEKVETPLGSFAFLICGDLFADDVVARLRDLRPDWLLFPFARCFDEDCRHQERWEREEKQQYLDRVRLAGVTTLMSNCLADVSLGGSFGGAMVVRPDGTIAASLPLGCPGLLLTDP